MANSLALKGGRIVAVSDGGVAGIGHEALDRRERPKGGRRRQPDAPHRGHLRPYDLRCVDKPWWSWCKANDSNVSNLLCDDIRTTHLPEP